MTGKKGIFRSLWGVENKESCWKALFPLLASSGFRGIEASLSDIGGAGTQKSHFFCDLLKSHDMAWICGLYTSWNDYEGEWQERTVDEHLVQFEEQLKLISSLPVAPTYINCHSGSDSFSRSQSVAFFRGAQEIHKKTCPQIPLGHETHRGRILYSPWIALDLVKDIPELCFTLDLSHWIVVAERKLALELLEPVLQRTRHIHARIGSSQAPQLSDPAEATSESPDFVRYFRSVWARTMELNGTIDISMTPEYGPIADNYMPKIGKGENGQWTGRRQLDELIMTEAQTLASLYYK